MPERISDEELRQRLQEHNYSVPPITSTTRSVLLKKLKQLSDQKAQLSRQHKKNTVSRMDYSSAEEDFTPAVSSTKKNCTGYKSRTPTIRNGGSSQQHCNNYDYSFKTPPPLSSTLRGGGQVKHKNGPSTAAAAGLMSQSSEDEDEEDEEEESEEADEDSDDKYDDFEEEVTAAAAGRVPKEDLAVQTSFISPEPAPETRFRSRPNTSSSTGHVSGGGGGGSISMSMASSSYPITSQKIRQNIDKFGSLNEALATLPTAVQPSRNHSHSSPPTQPAAAAPLTPSTSGVCTQVQRSNPPQNNRTSSGSAMPISTLIICLAMLFFSFVGYQYFNLTKDQTPRKIPVCTRSSQKECIPPEQLESTEAVLMKMLKLLRAEEESCAANPSKQYKINDLKQRLGLSSLDQFENLIGNVLILLKQNPSWGIQPIYQGTDGGGEATHLDVIEPASFGLICWLKYLVASLVGLLLKTAHYLVALASIMLVVGIVYWAWKRWRQKQKQQRKEMFSFVDNVLKLLHDHHQRKSKEVAAAAAAGPSYIAIDHIRDQLIAPHERAMKGDLWKSVVEYMSNNESRVREDIQIVHGEEFRVWQWLPDLPLPLSSSPTPSPTLSGHGSPKVFPTITRSPNNRTPFVQNGRPSPGPSQLSGSSGVRSTTAETATPRNKPENWHHHFSSSPPPTSASCSPGWQGSAFQSSTNLATGGDPPPTTCLKVRYMFSQPLHANQEITLKKDIVSRCRDAQILHIAVDRESPEGVVYIKMKSKTDAGIVFNCLHGQWYKNQLVSAKYLKLERYHHRFPDSVRAEMPMTPSGN